MNMGDDSPQWMTSAGHAGNAANPVCTVSRTAASSESRAALKPPGALSDSAVRANR
jgi:hypothetical protein